MEDDEDPLSFDDLVVFIKRVRLDMLIARQDWAPRGHKRLFRPLRSSEFFKQLAEILEVKFPRNTQIFKTYGDIARFVIEARAANRQSKGGNHVA